MRQRNFPEYPRLSGAISKERPRHIANILRELRQDKANAIVRAPSAIFVLADWAHLAAQVLQLVTEAAEVGHE